MRKKKLCSRCEVGRYTMAIDKRSSECPYIAFHNGEECSMFKERKHKMKSTGIVSRLSLKLKQMNRRIFRK